MQRKFIIGVSLVALAIAVIGSGVLYALYSDSQTSSGNTFTSGTLLLQVGTAVPTTDHIALSGMKPGDTGNAANWQLQNIGTIAGDLTIQVSAITNTENSVNTAEIAAGESPTNTVGDMGANLQVAFWVDADHSGTWTTGDYYMKSDGTKVGFQSGDSGLPAAAYATLNSYDSKTWSNIQTNIPAGSFGWFRAEYNLPSSTGNRVQSDSAAFSVTFTLNQH